jgi:hypothetical protein
VFTTIAKARDLKCFVEDLNDFLQWLLSATSTEFSLSSLAERICYFFAIEYCSIHIRSAGELHHLSGSFAADSHQELPPSLMVREDHPINTQELADEQTLDVRNFPIPFLNESSGLLVVKSDSLLNESIQTIAGLIALFMKAATKIS